MAQVFVDGNGDFVGGIGRWGGGMGAWAGGPGEAFVGIGFGEFAAFFSGDDDFSPVGFCELRLAERL